MDGAEPITPEMEFDELHPLRRAGAGDAEETPGVKPEYPPGAGVSTNPIAQLVADLIETTGLIPLDRWRARVPAPAAALLRGDHGRAAQRTGRRARGSGLRTGPRGSSNAEARELAERLHLPYVDLASSGVEKGAAEAIPVHVLERVGALRTGSPATS